MERLRDSKLASGSPEAELADALAAMEPIAPSASRRHRVWRGVRDRGDRGFGLVLLRPAVAGVVLLAAGAAAAGATVGRGWLARGWSQLVSRPAAVMPAVVAAPRRVPAPPPSRAPQPEPPAAPELPAPATRPAVRVAAHVRPRAEPPRGEDPSALVEAVRALRGAHDPARAAHLLDDYLRAYPRGALAEEALALQIEAAATLKSPRAAAFARQYLRDYPNGRFRAVAEQAQKSL